MSIETLLGGADSYTTLAEVAAGTPEVDVPEASPVLISIVMETIVATLMADC